MLRAFGHHVAMCCDVLGVVGSNLKMVKFFMQHLWILHDVVVVWPGSCIAPGHAHQFDFQLATCRNTLQQGGQTHATCCAQQCCDRLTGASKCWANNVGICCAEVLLSFGWGFKLHIFNNDHHHHHNSNNNGNNNSNNGNGKQQQGTTTNQKS